MQPTNNRFSEEYLKAAHRSTFANEREILASEECRCCYCGSHFKAADEEPLLWAEERPPLGRTLHCPNCLVDCVIGSASGYPINDEDFIRACSEAWFAGASAISRGETVHLSDYVYLVVD